MDDKRVEELEFQLAHLQRQYDQLNEVVTEQANTIDRLRQQVSKLEASVSNLKTASQPPTDPLDEKPPHY